MADQNQARRLFLGCFMALVATAFAFAIRGGVLGQWQLQFHLHEEENGILNGVGLYPFAISIIIFSLFVDRIGYGTAMGIAFVGHVVATVLTIFASSFQMLYIAIFIYTFSNGVVESVINPVVATVYKDNKTHWLNILHAGWPGGLAVASLLFIGLSSLMEKIGPSLPGEPWRWYMAVPLIPTLIYGYLLFGLRFPAQERVEAGVSYREMLSEFGWASAYIVSFLLIMGVSQLLSVFKIGQPVPPQNALLFAIIPAVLFAFYIHSFGRPVFVFLLLVMTLLATTELGTDSWIQNIISSVLKSPMKGAMFFVWTSTIMFVLRFFAGPIVHRISPLGLLAASAAIATCGLLWLGNAGNNIAMLIAAATLYALGKTFFWPTTLGVVSEQYPRGGALLLSGIGGVGMIAVGTLGAPAIGTLQDVGYSRAVQQQEADIYPKVEVTTTGLFSEYQAIDQKKVDELPKEEQDRLAAIGRETKQYTLAKIAVLPAIMCVCYLGLIAYYRSRGGYQAQVLTGHAANDEKFTGGVPGAIEG
jgi:MFS family permease